MGTLMTKHTVTATPAAFCKSLQTFFTCSESLLSHRKWLLHIKVSESSESGRRITRLNNLVENPGGQYWGQLRDVSGLNGIVAQGEIVLQVSGWSQQWLQQIEFLSLTALCLMDFGDIVLYSYRSFRVAICVIPRTTLEDRQRDTTFILEAASTQLQTLPPPSTKKKKKKSWVASLFPSGRLECSLLFLAHGTSDIGFYDSNWGVWITKMKRGPSFFLRKQPILQA